MFDGKGFSLIAIFRRVKSSKDEWGYEFDSLAFLKDRILNNEEFGRYPVSMLDKISDDIFDEKVKVETPYYLSNPFAYCKISNKMLNSMAEILDSSAASISKILKIVSDACAKIELKLIDKNENKYEVIKYKKSISYKEEQRNKNVDYVSNLFETYIRHQFKEQYFPELNIDEQIDDLYKIKEDNKHNKIKNPRDFDIDIDTPLYTPNLNPQQSTSENVCRKLDLSNLDIDKVISEINEKIVGQENAVESIVTNIFANQRIIDTGNSGLIATQKTSILLDGPTGTGKTAIVKEVSDKFSVPIVIKNSTSYSTTGYVGDSITDILAELIEKAHGDIELAQRGIVCLDEFDKLGEANKQSEIRMRRAVQQELLPFISGGKFQVQVGGHLGKKYEFDTSNLTFIGMGAFTELRENKIAQKKKASSIGFISEPKEDDQDKTYEITEQDYIDYGIERELVGRFALLTSTKAYSVEDFKKILLTSIISPIKTFIEFAKSQGIEEVTYDSEFIEKMSQMAYDANFGARGLHKIMQDIKNTLLRDMITGKLKKINLTTEMLEKSKEKSIRTY